MSRFERLQDNLNQIREEAQRKEAEKFAAQTEAERKKAVEEEEKRKREIEIGEAIPRFKEVTSEIFRQVNEEVFHSEGNIEGWKTVQVRNDYQKPVNINHIDFQHDTNTVYRVELRDQLQLDIPRIGAVFCYLVLAEIEAVGDINILRNTQWKKVLPNQAEFAYTPLVKPKEIFGVASVSIKNLNGQLNQETEEALSQSLLKLHQAQLMHD